MVYLLTKICGGSESVVQAKACTHRQRIRGKGWNEQTNENDNNKRVEKHSVDDGGDENNTGVREWRIMDGMGRWGD